MFKKAYVRGITKALVDCGAVKFANEDQAVAAADHVAEGLPEQPVGEVAPEATAELAANLVDLSNSLQKGSQQAAEAAATVTGSKAASWNRAANLLRRKLAVDTGSTIVGTRPEQENTPANSVNAENKLDQINRPGGDAYANVGEDGVGRQQASGEGAVASEKPREPNAMGPAHGGSNSVTEAVKGASLRNYIRSVAMGKRADALGATIAPGNTPPPTITGEGLMEQQRRPAGYAVKGEDGVGLTDFNIPAAGVVGVEQAHPGQEGHEGGTNTAIKQSEARYIRELHQIGQKYASYLPFYMNDNEKVAALQYLLSLPPTDRDITVGHIAKTAELPEGLKNYIANKKGEGEGEKKEEPGEHEKEETPAEEKKEEAKKAASYRAKDGDILARLRRMNASA